MRSLFCNPLFCQDKDPLSFSYGRKTMGDNKGCTVLCQFLQRLLDDLLAFIIQSRSCLIKDQDRRIL